MSDAQATAADKALETALAEAGARDPREFYRERLRDLKQANPAEYESAVAYYRGTLIPDVAGGQCDPLDAWTEYGRRLAAALAPGRTLSLDETGFAHEYDRPDRERLVLHFPDEKGARALLVGLPAALSTAQRAAYDVLVEGRQKATS
ncbi:MAG: hypothetical protein OEO79_12720 [Gemmatimonadota bacterium]|nr:hypothetical protein [Gemmatimonadota bacterium]